MVTCHSPPHDLASSTYPWNNAKGPRPYILQLSHKNNTCLSLNNKFNRTRGCISFHEMKGVNVAISCNVCCIIWGFLLSRREGSLLSIPPPTCKSSKPSGSKSSHHAPSKSPCVIRWRSWSLTITKSTFHHHLPDCINPLQVLDLSSQCPIPNKQLSKPLWTSTIPISDQFMTGSWLNDFQDRASQSWKVTSSFSCEISAQSCFTLPGYLAEVGLLGSKDHKDRGLLGPKMQGNLNFYQRLPPATAIDGHDELHERHAPSALSQPYHVVPKRNCHEDIYIYIHDHFLSDIKSCPSASKLLYKISQNDLCIRGLSR